MEMFLMALCLSLLGLAVAAIAFGAATRRENPSLPAEPDLRPFKAAAPSRFFGEEFLPPHRPGYPVSTEVLLAQIENHVRQEQAAAQSFLESPSQAQLHSKTNSAFVN